MKNCPQFKKTIIILYSKHCTIKRWPFCVLKKCWHLSTILKKFQKQKIHDHMCSCEANVQLLKNTIPILPFRENVVWMGAGVSRPRKAIKVIVIATRVDIGVITVIVMQMKTPRGRRRLLKDGTASRTQCRAMPEEKKNLKVTCQGQDLVTVSQSNRFFLCPSHPQPPLFSFLFFLSFFFLPPLSLICSLKHAWSILYFVCIIHILYFNLRHAQRHKRGEKKEGGSNHAMDVMHSPFIALVVQCAWSLFFRHDTAVAKNSLNSWKIKSTSDAPFNQRDFSGFCTLKIRVQFHWIVHRVFFFLFFKGGEEMNENGQLSCFFLTDSTFLVICLERNQSKFLH